MDEILQKLLSNEVFTDETKAAIRESFISLKESIEKETSKQVRKELVAEFDQNKKRIYAALEQYVENEIGEPMKELHEQVQQVEALKKTLADKIVSIQEEVRADHEKKMAALMKTVESILAHELTELHESEKTNRRAYLNRMNEKEAEFAQMKEQFRKKAALVLENVIDIKAQGMLDELYEEIKAANQADFGRELFEAFQNMFRRQFFNSEKEFRTLFDQNRKLSESLNRVKKVASKQIQEAQKAKTIAETAHRRLEESVQRDRVMHKMLGGLKGEVQSRMRTMLEACQSVEQMQRTYKKYLPEMLNEAVVSNKNEKISKKVLEIKEGGASRLGNDKEQLVEDNSDDELTQIKRLSGIRS